MRAHECACVLAALCARREITVRRWCCVCVRCGACTYLAVGAEHLAVLLLGVARVELQTAFVRVHACVRTYVLLRSRARVYARALCVYLHSEHEKHDSWYFSLCASVRVSAARA